MFAKAVLAFLALPGVVAFAVPIACLLADVHPQLRHPLGLVPLVVGVLGLLWCVRDFYVAGKGTLAPWAPPVHLVVVGLYRYTRNPMYVCVTLIVLGWAVSFGLPVLYVYTIIVVVAFYLRVVFGEEPWLARTHGDQWQDYASRVPRWLL
jgi:protein-S-isoprenylcysteine O-methyltransferase Ste14